MSLSEKAKTVPMQQCLSCSEIIPDTHEDAVSHSRAKHDVITNFRPIKVSMILLSVAQQEIDEYGKNNEALAKVCSNLNDKIERLERERGLQKQKLQQFEEFLVAWIENDVGKKKTHYYPSQDLDLILDFFFELRELLK